MDKYKNGLLFKPNFQLFAGEGDAEIEIDGKKYNADTIKGVLGELETTRGSLETLQGSFNDIQGKYTTLEEELKGIKNKGKPELEVLKGQYDELLKKYDTDTGELKTAIQGLELGNRKQILISKAKALDLPEELYQEIEVSVEDTEESIIKKVEDKQAMFKRILEKEAEKAGIVIKGGKPHQKEKGSYGASLADKGEGAKRKPKYDLSALNK